MRRSLRFITDHFKLLLQKMRTLRFSTHNKLTVSAKCKCPSGFVIRPMLLVVSLFGALLSAIAGRVPLGAVINTDNSTRAYH